MSATSNPGPAPSAADRDAGAADLALVERILAGDETAFEVLMRRHNQLLFRAARSILGDSDAAEDVVQEACLKAYRAFAAFEGHSRLSTWLVKIAVHKALTRAGRDSRVVALHAIEGDHGEIPDDGRARASGWLGDSRRGPEDALADRELGSVLATAVDQLPLPLRTVFMLRGVEGLSVDETADAPSLPPEAVRVRHHRAKAALRQSIEKKVTGESRRLFAFGNQRCDRVVAAVFERLRRDASFRPA